jgi:DNA polymerase phi
MSLALYKPLGDNNEKIRLGAAKQLTSELAAILSTERTETSKKDVDYALKRLTRGLASGRESARPGFAVVLTEVDTLCFRAVFGI